jgi:hypothetical protein
VSAIKEAFAMATAQTPVWFITAASSGFGKYMALEALSRPQSHRQCPKHITH